MAKETVGDMIVRHRRAEMERHPSRRKEILKRFRPRSLQNQTWPPAR